MSNKEAIQAWVREDAPVGIKMMFTPELMDKLVDRLSSINNDAASSQESERDMAIGVLLWAYDRGDNLRDYKEAFDALRFPPCPESARVMDLARCLKSISESNIGDGPGQINGDTIKQVARNAISQIDFGS